jgi:hypothetical protein
VPTCKVHLLRFGYTSQPLDGTSGIGTLPLWMHVWLKNT